jgi:protein-S-isoprenylcysteine O-methyltransferase Ste14
MEARMYLLITLVQSIVFFGLAPAAVIFLLAGRWDLWNVWAYAGISITAWSFQTLAMQRLSPGLLKERVQPSDRGRQPLAALGAIGVFILYWGIIGLDQRFHWSDIVPPAGMVVGLALVAIGLGFLTWSMLVNSFFSTAVRIQEDRGQKVISAGPYGVVRHPGYAGGLLAMFASGLALNSLLALIAALIFLVVLVHRTAIEDRMLQGELAGYADYAAKVRYRLVPGVW